MNSRHSYKILHKRGAWGRVGAQHRAVPRPPTPCTCVRGILVKVNRQEAEWVRQSMVYVMRITINRPSLYVYGPWPMLWVRSIIHEFMMFIRHITINETTQETTHFDIVLLDFLTYSCMNTEFLRLIAASKVALRSVV